MPRYTRVLPPIASILVSVSCAATVHDDAPAQRSSTPVASASAGVYGPVSEVRCSLARSWDFPRSVQAEVDVPGRTPGAPFHLTVPWRFEANDLVLRVPAAALGPASLFGEGFLPTSFHASVADGCRDLVVVAPAFVTGTVRASDGRPFDRAFVEGCDAYTLSDEQGRYRLPGRPGTPCEIRASTLRPEDREGPSVRITFPEAGREATADLSVATK